LDSWTSDKHLGYLHWASSVGGTAAQPWGRLASRPTVEVGPGLLLSASLCPWASLELLCFQKYLHLCTAPCISLYVSVFCFSTDFLQNINNISCATSFL